MLFLGGIGDYYVLNFYCSTVANGASQMIDRPKMNLKPCSQPLDQSDERCEKERLVKFVTWSGFS